MEAHFNPILVALSILVAIFSSYVALNLAQSVTHTKGRSRTVWLICGALAMGTGIWSMHFLGMLAFEDPGMMVIAYDVPLMLLSIVVAIGASLLGFYVVSQPVVPSSSIISGGMAMAAGISGMHYIGMYSMRMNAVIQWDVFVVVLSIVVALVASWAALKILVELRDKPERIKLMILASLIMGLAIAGMHYVGMYAATFIHVEAKDFGNSDLFVITGLSAAVTTTTLLVLGLALAGSVGQKIIMHFKRLHEQVLVRNEQRYRMLIEAVKDYAIFMLDPTGQITSWNSGAQRITGYRANEVIGRDFSIFYTKEDLDINFPSEELRMALRDGHFETEGRRVRKDGSQFWANVVIAPVYEMDGQLKGFSKVTRDITALKEAEARMLKLNEELEKRVESRTLALQQREYQLRSITNAIPVLIGQVDAQERILYANEMLSKWFGRNNQDIRGLTIRELFGDFLYEANKPYILSALSGKVTNYERISVRQGQQRVLGITFVPEFDDKGIVVGFTLVASDISKHKEVEEELKKAKDEADVANQTKSAFLANMSHEIRTPLGAVLGFSELLMSDDIDQTEREKCVEVIKRNGQLLSNIINDILDLSKVEAGKLETEKVSIPFSEVMAEMGSLHNLGAVEKGIDLKVYTEGFFPNFIQTDPLRLRQILLNIIGNAIKFTGQGRVDVTIKMVAGKSENMKLSFTVKDTGEGIQPEKAAKLFAPFTQADVSTTRRFGGTGLGLILSKKLANALGGDIVLERSVPGVGSTFVITVDAGVTKDFLQSPHKVQDHQKILIKEPAIALNDFKVLVVDDSLENQVLIKTYLSVAGAVVETASNGKEGVELALGGDFDLILMDLQMPEMDGYQAMSELKLQNYNKPVIALTAHAMIEDRRRCLESGFSAHLTKPIDRRTLLGTLAEYYQQ